MSLVKVCVRNFQETVWHPYNICHSPCESLYICANLHLSTVAYREFLDIFKMCLWAPVGERGIEQMYRFTRALADAVQPRGGFTWVLRLRACAEPMHLCICTVRGYAAALYPSLHNCNSCAHTTRASCYSMPWEINVMERHCHGVLLICVG